MVKAKFKAFSRIYHILNIIVYCSSVYSGSGLVIKAESLYDSYLRATYLFNDIFVCLAEIYTSFNLTI